MIKIEVSELAPFKIPVGYRFVRKSPLGYFSEYYLFPFNLIIRFVYSLRDGKTKFLQTIKATLNRK